jgi:hypothetical protein
MLLFNFYNNTILSKYYHSSKKKKKRNSKRQSKGGSNPAYLIQTPSINKININNEKSKKKSEENNLFDEHSIHNISLGGEALEETMKQIEESKKNISSEKETEFISINYENYPFEITINDEFRKNNIEYIIEENLPQLLTIFIIKMIFESQKITYKETGSNQKIELSMVKIKKKIKQNELYETLAWLVDNIDIYKKIIFISVNNILSALGTQKKKQEKNLWSKIKNLFSAKQNTSLIKTKNKLLEQLKKLSKIDSELNQENIEEILYLLIHNINIHPHRFLNTIIDENFFKYALYNMSPNKKQTTLITKKEEEKGNKQEQKGTPTEERTETQKIANKELLNLYIKTVLEIFED